MYLFIDTQGHRGSSAPSPSYSPNQDQPDTKQNLRRRQASLSLYLHIRSAALCLFVTPSYYFNRAKSICDDSGGYAAKTKSFKPALEIAGAHEY